MSTGTILRVLRQAAGMTQHQLEEHTQRHGLKQPRISLIEKGEAMPTAVQLAVILKAVGASDTQRLGILEGLSRGG